MKSLLQFITDSFVVTLVLGLIVVSFLVTFALSPIEYKDSSFAVADEQSVLGERSDRMLQFEPRWKNTTELEIVQNRKADLDYELNIHFQSLKHEYSTRLLNVRNNSSTPQKLLINASVAQSTKDNLRVYLESKTAKSEIDLNNSSVEMFVIQPSENLQLKLIIEPLNDINFSSELVLEFSSVELNTYRKV